MCERCIALVLAGALFLAFVGVAESATRRVPSEFATINAALDVSAAGDTVLVAPGTYTDSETRDFGLGAPVTACAFLADGAILKSEAGPLATSINLTQPGTQASTVAAVLLSTTETSVEGFTITGIARGSLALSSDAITFRDCVFRDLTAGASSGGGIVQNGELVVEDCVFENCVGNTGGAIYHANGRVEMRRCVVTMCGNKGVYLDGGGGGAVESSLVEDCDFVLNASTNTAGGLHIANHLGGAVVRRCRFVGNTAESNTGGLGISGFGDKLVEDCVFIRNGTADPFAEVGALSIISPGIVRRNTFWENSHLEVGRPGSAIRITGLVTLENNVIASSAGGPDVSADFPPLGGCNVYWNNPDGVGIALLPNDVVANPLFCDPGNDDFRVQVDSPCVEPNSAGCGQIGAFGVGCGVIQVRSKSWSEIKGQYTTGEER